jgi:HK97 gp10 family phage protein
MTINGPEKYMEQLSKLGKDSTKICSNALKVGAGIVADEIRNELESLTDEKFRKLQTGDSFVGTPKGTKKDLIDSFGITPVSTDRDGIINVKIGFDGYGSYPTKKYTKGVPNALVARAIESGSSVRQKTPFVRKAVNRSKKKSVEEMGKSIEADLTIYAL